MKTYSPVKMDSTCPYSNQILWIMAILGFLLSCVTKVVTSDQTASACFNQTEKSLTLTCPLHHMVRVTRVIQGHSQSGSCSYSPDDCVFVEKHKGFPCVGRQTCQINLPSGDLGYRLHMCDSYATYMHVEYTCVHESETTDICADVPSVLGQRGYISSPRYPYNYPNSRLCTLAVRSPSPTQKLRLYVVELVLEGDTLSGCDDYLYIYDGHRGHTLCGTRTLEELALTMDNHVELTFGSNDAGKQKGFWLYYEAEPYINLTTPMYTTESAIPDGVPQSTGPSLGVGVRVGEGNGVNSNNRQHTPSHSDSLGFPIGLIVGIVLGALLCALIIVLIIILLRRRHMKMLHQSASCASDMAIMASKLNKPVSPQTMNNTLHQQPPRAMQDTPRYAPAPLHKPDNTRHVHESPLQGTGIKVPSHKDFDLDSDIYKPAGPYRGQYIDRSFGSTEDQLFC